MTTEPFEETAMTDDDQDIDAPVNPAHLFRKKPVVISAVQLEWSTWSDMCDHAGVGSLQDGKPQGGFAVPGNEAGTFADKPMTDAHVMALAIPTLEGLMIGVEHDWIIRGVAGELYPCKPGIFDQTYEPVPPPCTVPMCTLPEHDEAMHRDAKGFWFTFTDEGMRP